MKYIFILLVLVSQAANSQVIKINVKWRQYFNHPDSISTNDAIDNGLLSLKELLQEQSRFILDIGKKQLKEIKGGDEKLYNLVYINLIGETYNLVAEVSNPDKSKDYPNYTLGKTPKGDYILQYRSLKGTEIHGWFCDELSVHLK